AEILEIGAGTGEQAAQLSARGFRVSAVDLDSSNYSGERVYPIQDYDGINLPFEDARFDIVFSSNVLEHVTDLQALQRDMARVLRPGGLCVHLMPTPAWRFWTIVSTFPNNALFGWQLCRVALGHGVKDRPYIVRVARAGYVFLRRMVDTVRQPRHGERGNTITELWYFSPRWWRAHFEANGYRVVSARPSGLFYTGNMLFGSHLSIPARRHVAGWLGSACHLYIVEPVDGSTAEAPSKVGAEVS
ncbi:MAG: class I SAM-dependent methyltransferase, partial [Hyphomicrobiaceae bacterium]